MNRQNNKDKVTFNKIIDALKKCDTIKFDSYITNEEALMLQILKDKLNIKLINDDAKAYQDFIQNYSKTSGNSLYLGNTKDLINSDGIIVFGTRLTNDNPDIKYIINQALKKTGAKFVYMHPIDDISLQDRYTQFIKYEVGSEEGVIALLTLYLAVNTSKQYQDYLEDLDIGYLSGESSVGEEELEDIVQKLIRKQNKTLIVGTDLFGHKKSTNLGKLVGVIDKYTDFNVVVVPSQTNTLGVSLICNLDKDAGVNIVEYKEKVNFQVLASNQQKGTFVNFDKKVVDTNVVLNFDGYYLNDIVNEFLEYPKNDTIDYTCQLPFKKGFKNINFNDSIGYELTIFKKDIDENMILDEIEDIDTYNGLIIYNCDLSNYKYTTESLLTKNSDFLVGGSSFATVTKIKDNDMVKIMYNNQTYKKIFKVDKFIKGTVALYGTDNQDDDISKGYRFKQVKIERQTI